MAKLDDLITKLQGNATPYTALTDDQIQAQAKNRYASTYDQYRLSAQQQYEADDSALGRQITQLQADYDKQRKESTNEFKQTYAQTNRAALGRGMQRASYTGATLANVDRAGLKAQQDITDSQVKQENQIGEQRTALSQTLAKQLSEYNIKQQSEELDYTDKLSDREYTRTTDNRGMQNDVAAKIYEYQHQLEVEAEEARRWNEEMRLKKAELGMDY